MEINAKSVKDQPLTLREKETIKARDNYTCKYCGCRNKLILTIDHKISLSRGGTSTFKNCVCSCIICNQLKGSLTAIEFRKYIKGISELYQLNKISLTIPTTQINLKFTPSFTPELKQ